MVVEIPEDAYTAEAQIGFQYDDSNEFAYGAGIDNVRIYANTTGVDKLDEKIDMQVFPNPSDGRFRIYFTGIDREDIPYRLVTLDGREIENSKFVIRGESSFELDLRSRPDGIYYLSVDLPEKTFSRILVKN